MTDPAEPKQPTSIPGACASTLQQLQAAFDGELDWELATQHTADHRRHCPDCQQRWAAARLLQRALAQMASAASSVDAARTAAISARLRQHQEQVPQQSLPLGRPTPSGSTAAGRSDRSTPSGPTLAALCRQRWAHWTALAFAVVLAVYSVDLIRSTVLQTDRHQPTEQLVQQVPSPPVPAVVSRHEAVPLPPSSRLQEQLARAADVLWDAVDGWTVMPPWPTPEATTAPTPPAQGPQHTPPWSSLIVSVRTGLEPVTDTTQKAFDRLLKDIRAWQPSPKS